MRSLLYVCGVILFVFGEGRTALAQTCETPDLFPECRNELAHRIWADYRLAGVSQAMPAVAQRVLLPEVECFRPERVALTDQAKRLEDIRIALLQETRRTWASQVGQRYRAQIERCQARQFEFHKLAARASEAVYRLEAPPGYQTVRAESRGDFSDIQSMLLRPDDLTQAYVFAIAGTESLSDLRSDLSFGSDQFFDRRQEVRRQIRQILDRGHDVVITGHSLGGGLAQGFASDLADEILREFERSGSADRPRGRLRLVTFNAFGGRGLEEITQRRDREHERRIQGGQYLSGSRPRPVDDSYYGVAIDHRIVRRQMVEESVHYRTQGDVVSRLGRHFGQVVDLPGPGVHRPLTAHRMSTLRGSLERTNPMQVCANESRGLRIADWVTQAISAFADERVLEAMARRDRERSRLTQRQVPQGEG